MSKKVSILFFVFILAVFLLSGCGSGQQTSGNSNQGGADNTANNEASGKENITLTYAFFAPANTFPAVQMQKWTEELEKRTNGQVKVELFMGGSLLDASNMYDGVRNRVVDIGLSATSYEPGKYPLLSISDMPSGYPNAYVASQVVYDLIQEYPPEAFNDVKIITAFTTEPAYVQTVDKIAVLEDFKGKQLRIAGALTDIVKRLGAAPVGMSQAEVPEALQIGVIDGYITSREVLLDFKLAEFVKYVVDYPLSINTFVAVMNKDVWNSLPADVQQVIDELSREMMLFTGEYHDNQVKESVEWSQKEHGLEIVTLTPEEKSRWDETLKGIQDEYVQTLEQQGHPAKEYQNKLNELLQKYKP
jgi:TRAP-type C4-dicarboxylate transport system substrate-binding protein